MSNGINRFDIQLDNPMETYSPGQTVSGKLIIELDRTKKLRGLKLRFKGECKIHWRETRRTGENREKITYNANEKYFEYDTYVFGEANDGTIEMAPGYRDYLFSFILPQSIPCSFEHDIGKIHYSITAIFDRPWKIDYRVKKIIKIVTPLELESSSHENIGINDGTDVNYCCLLPCLNVGKMLVRFRIPNTTVACGDTVDAIISINNKPNTLDISRVTMKIQRKLVFKAMDHRVRSKIEFKSIIKAAKLGPFQRNDEVRLEFQIPLDVFPNSHFDHCSIIDISYNLRIKIHVSGCHLSTVKNYALNIKQRSAGSVSLQPTPFPLAPNYLPLPGVHQDIGFTHAHLVPPSDNSNKFHLPSYELATADSNKNN